MANPSWTEEKHPRGEGGKFSTSPGGGHHPSATEELSDEDHGHRWNSSLKDHTSASDDDLGHAMRFASHLRNHHTESLKDGHITAEQHKSILDAIDNHVAKIQSEFSRRKPTDGKDSSAVLSPQEESPVGDTGATENVSQGTGGSVTDRHAATAEHIARAPKPIRSLLESFHKLRDVRKHGAGQSRELAPEYASEMYDHLKSISQTGDEFGEVHDLSDELGHGALGYSSPAGNLAMIPPKFKGEDWDVRYALPEENDVASDASLNADQPEGTQEAPESTESTAFPWETGGTQEVPETEPERARGVNARTQLGKAIIEAVGENPADQEAFAKLVDEIHDRKQREVSSRNNQLRDLLSQFGYEGRDMGAFIRSVQKYPDPSSFQRNSRLGKRFNQMVEMSQRDYPDLLKFDQAGEAFTHDPENALWNRLQTGLEHLPPKHSDDIIDEALSYVQAMGRSTAEHERRMQEDPEYARWTEAVMSQPFARRGAKLRYQWARKNLARWRKYGKQLSVFGEDEHPCE